MIQCAALILSWRRDWARSLAILNIATLIKLFRVQLSLRLKTVVGSHSVILKLLHADITEFKVKWNKNKKKDG